jgi:DNA-binding NtrC family response regulator
MKSTSALCCPPVAVDSPALPAQPLPTDACLMIVDDDASFRDGTRRLLHTMRTELPLRIVEADSGRAAVAALQNGDMDCVLLDYQMPGGTGLEWLQVILAARPAVVVIMATGVGDERISVEAMKRGATDYLVKGSISPDTLQRAIMNALQTRRMRETIRRQQDELLESERHRVMIESLGAACHHMGQPATVILAYLELMRRMRDALERGEFAAFARAELARRAGGDPVA